MNIVALYPGSFDPLTKGHVDIVQRALKLFPKIIIGVAMNVRKLPLFDLEERVDLWREVLDGDPKVEIDSYVGLLVDYARAKNVSAIIRGLRAVSDFEYEFQMAHMNHNLAPDIETFFMMTGPDCFYVSSQTVKEVASLGGNVENMVPPQVARRLKEKYGR
jgi:pantetheine-phosphate adenylyltransferase